ncbi:MAG: adaptor protein MecA, partial [bacterium]
RILAELRSNAKKRAPEMKKAVQEGEDRRVKDDLREANFDGEEKRDPEEMQAEPAKGMQKDDAKDDEPQVVNLKEETLGEDVFGEDFEKLRREANRQDDEENLEEDELPVLKEAEEPALPEDPAAAMANELRGKILEGLQKIFPDAHVEAVDLTTVRVSGENLDDAQKQLMRALSEKMKEAARERADKEMALANGGGDQEQNPERAGDAQRRNARRGRTAGRRQMQESLRLFAFDSLEDALSGAANVAFFTGESSLFHDRSGYSLVLRQGQSDLQDFNRVCNILTEYGEGKTSTPAAVAYLKEHAQSVFTGDAIAQLVAIEGK